MTEMNSMHYYYFYPRLGDATSLDDRYDGPLGVTLHFKPDILHFLLLDEAVLLVPASRM